MSSEKQPPAAKNVIERLMDVRMIGAVTGSMCLASALKADVPLYMGVVLIGAWAGWRSSRHP